MPISQTNATQPSGGGQNVLLNGQRSSEQIVYLTVPLPTSHCDYFGGDLVFEATVVISTCFQSVCQGMYWINANWHGQSYVQTYWQRTGVSRDVWK
mgnify:FL=1